MKAEVTTTSEKTTSPDVVDPFVGGQASCPAADGELLFTSLANPALLIIDVRTRDVTPTVFLAPPGHRPHLEDYRWQDGVIIPNGSSPHSGRRNVLRIAETRVETLTACVEECQDTAAHRKSSSHELRGSQEPHRIRRRNVTNPVGLDLAGTDTADFWRGNSMTTPSRVFTRSILGLFGIVAVISMVAVDLAAWRSSTDPPLALFPFARTAGGIAQFLAGMWAYCAVTSGGVAQFLAGMWAYHSRDALAAVMHGLWGSFWMAYGLYTLLTALGVLPPILVGGSAACAYGSWFVVLGVVTWIGAAAAITENVALAGVLSMLAAGCTLLAIGLLDAQATVLIIGAYQLITSALLAWYVAGAMVLHATFGRPVLPIGERRRHPHLDTSALLSIQYAADDSGVKVGQ
ncbi:GPR1/FUN34/YaaH family transporter [Pseudonocardia sp. CA-142604]|uniref:acetate uptake transporter family protein n=1 Tax=Pseudonocardia sp. CA-142604 TaxID=3240024 RepID=UPI003D94FD75